MKGKKEEVRMRSKREKVRSKRDELRIPFFPLYLSRHIILYLSPLTSYLILLTSFFIPLTSHAIDDWPQLETRHFLVIAEPTSQPEPVSLTDWNAILGQYIEQLDAVYVPLFGGQTLGQIQSPLGQKPILLICANKASYLRRLGEYGIANPAEVAGSGGYYHPDANVIFTWRQPTDYYSRHVVLHEVAHWYCLQLLGSRYGKIPLWFCEGLADHAAFHTWDGKTLYALQLPQVTLENYPGRLIRLQTSGFGLQERASVSSPEVASSESETITPDNISFCFDRLQVAQETETFDVIYNEYALAWGMVAFLIDEFPLEMTQLFGLLSQNDMSDSWQSAFDDTIQPTWSHFADWVAEHQHPWRWVWNHWEDTGGHLIGISDSTALIVQNPDYKSRRTIEPDSEIDDKSEVTLLCCGVKPLLDRTVIGLVFRYESNDCFEMLQFRIAGKNITEWQHIRFTQNQWEALSGWRKIQSFENHANDDGFVLEIRQTDSSDGPQLRFYFNSRIVTELANDADSPFGLAVQSGAAQFRVVRLSPENNDPA